MPGGIEVGVVCPVGSRGIETDAIRCTDRSEHPRSLPHGPVQPVLPPRLGRPYPHDRILARRLAWLEGLDVFRADLQQGRSRLIWTYAHRVSGLSGQVSSHRSGDPLALQHYARPLREARFPCVAGSQPSKPEHSLEQGQDRSRYCRSYSFSFFMASLIRAIALSVSVERPALQGALCS